MKILTLYRLVTYQFLSSLLVLLLVEIDGTSGKSDVKTKLLLQNIRTRLAQKADEMIKKKECESGLIFCKSPRGKEGDEEKSEEISPPPKIIRGQHKPVIKVSPKDVVQTFMPKAHKGLFRKTQRVQDNENHKKIIHSFGEVSEPKQMKKEDVSEEVKPSKKHNIEELNLEAVREPKQMKKKDVSEEVEPSKKHVEDLKKPVMILKQDSKKEDKSSSDMKLPKPTKVTLKPEVDEDHIKKTSKKIIKFEEPKNVTRTAEKKKEMKKSDKPKHKKKTKAVEGKTSESGLSTIPGAFIFVLEPDALEPNLCSKHSQIYLKQLKKHQIWALMMYDASAKITSGFLQGNINQYGDFDECLAINAVFKNLKNKFRETSGIRGKYCLANVDIKTASESQNLRVALERVESFQFIKSSIHDVSSTPDSLHTSSLKPDIQKFLRPGHFIPRFTTVNWGMCVPSACLAEDVEKFLKSRFENFNATGLQFDVNIDEDNCVVKDDLKFKFPTGTMVVIGFYVAVLSISLYATFMDAKTHGKPKQLSQTEKTEPETDKDTRAQDESEVSGNRNSAHGKYKKILMAFSLHKNVEKLLSHTNKGDIECINGIKSVFTIMLYFAHKTIPLGMTPFSNRVFLTKISNQPVTILLRASIIYTDSFLLISGMLTSYNLAKEISKNKKISWAKKTIARFIRLTPALLAVVLFYAYVWNFLGSGPMWNLIINRNSALCRKYLWRNLLYIQNLFAFENMCAPQTHQLALDMQLSLLAPLFVHLLHTYDKTGVGILQAFFILSSILRYITASNNNLSVVIYHGMPVSQLYKTANLLYGQAFHRASPYILGTIVGYYLKRFEKQSEMPKAFAALGWILSFTFGFYSVVSPSPLAQRSYQYDVQEAAQYAALSPVAWSLALSWLIVACHLGFGGILNDFLCQRIFLVFSRISYSVYLTQFLVFFYKVGVTRISELFTFSGSVNVNEMMLVIGISLILTLLFDMPMMEIKKIILDESDLNIPPEGSPKGESDVQATDFPVEVESIDVSEEISQDTTEDLVEPIEDEDGGEYEDEEANEEEIGDEDEEANEEELGYEDKEANEEEIGDEDEEANEEELGDEDKEANEEEIGEEDDGGEEGSDENADESEVGAEEDDFEVRPLRRSTRMHLSDDSEDRKLFNIEPDLDEDE